MRYNAFISYRHSELDMEIAKKVHSGLETYHVPGPVRKKTGKKKIERVFRDQEELPIGSDLNDNISGALAQSEYLIVICSPRTPESYWVCKEIESFIQMHDREHILAVLIEGEPNESFPPQLLTDDKGNPVEPLAADVRGADKKEMNKKFKTEILRLAAPVLGCSYDDLRQRHKERIIKRTIALVSAGAAVLALAGTAFGLYNAVVAKQMEKLANEKSLLAAEKSQLADEKTQLAEEILLEYKDKQMNQSRFYAEKSLSLLNQGYREDAVLVAKEALPYDGNDRPYVPEAEYALASALHAYDGNTDYNFDRVLKHDVRVDTVKTNKSMTKAVSLDMAENVYIWDAEDWSLKAKISAEYSEESVVVEVVETGFFEDGIGVIRKNGFTKYDFDGNEIFRIDVPTEVSAGTISEYGNEAAMFYRKPIEKENPFDIILSSDYTYLADVISSEKEKVIASFEVDYNIVNNTRINFNKPGDKLFIADVPLTIEEEKDDTTLDVFDIATGERARRKLSSRYLINMTVNRTGYVTCLTQDAGFFDDISDTSDRIFYLDLLDENGENIVWSAKVAIDQHSYLYSGPIFKASDFTKDGEAYDCIELIYGNNAFTFDAKTGKCIMQTSMQGMAEGAVTYMDSNQMLVAFSNGVMSYMYVDTGVFKDNNLQTGKTIDDLIPCSYSIIVVPAKSSELFVCHAIAGSDFEEIATPGRTEYMMNNSQNNDYFITQCYDDDSLDFYDHDGKKIYSYNDFDYLSPKAMGFLEDKVVYMDNDGLWLIDPKNQKADSYSWADLVGKEGFTIMGGYITDNGKYLVIWNTYSVNAFDTESREMLYSWTYDYFGEDQLYVDEVIISEDGSRLYFVQENGKTVFCDVSDSEAELKSFGTEEIQTICENNSLRKLKMSRDGKYVSVYCMDNKIRIIDAKTEDTVFTIPVQAQMNLFMEFSEDNKYMAVQGDDYILRIWDLAKQESVGEIEMDYGAAYMIYDDEDGLVAVVCSRSLWLLETETFKIVAKASGSGKLSYLPQDNAILSSDNSSIYRVRYKDYKQLLEEAERQFPGLELSEEKKRKYNID